jgi:pyrimidine-specific ribonucleoside hydrolase
VNRKRLLFGFLGLLILLVTLIGPAAPLLFRLGIEPVCIQGDFPDLKFVSCPSTAPTPLPLQTPAGQAPVPLIFDDDGSPDGMAALLFFLSNPLYEVKAVTVSPGEAHPQLFAGHLTRLLASLGRSDIPVGYGRDGPLDGNNSFPQPWREASDVFWDISLPDARDPSKPVPAVKLIIETLKSSPQPVEIFISGTHTNFAEVLRLDPESTGQISRIYLMGGSLNISGNIGNDWPEIQNSVSEWNIWVDPVAAREVFASGIPLVIMPLDGTNQVTWTASDARKWASTGSSEGELSSSLLRWMLGVSEMNKTYIWDLAAAAALTDPRLCPQVPLSLGIIVEPGPEQGRTIILDQPPNVLACLEPDAEQVKMRVEKILVNNP